MLSPPPAFLTDVFRHLPFLVIHVSTDGIVLHVNPEALRVTGYLEQELIGQNLWALLFPGRLFAQVPRFISLISPSPLLKDVPMTIRTRSGEERIIAWSRYQHNGGVEGEAGGGSKGGPRSFICIGVDLTDRLLDAERTLLSDPETRNAGSGGMGVGPHAGNAIDSEIVTPIAITPKPVGAGGGATGPCPIEQVHDGLTQVETHIKGLNAAFSQGEMQAVQALATAVGDATGGPAPRHGGLAFELLACEHQAQFRACSQSLSVIRARVEDLLASYSPQIQ